MVCSGDRARQLALLYGTLRAGQELGSAKTTIRPYDNRLDDSVSCKSEEGDPEIVSCSVVFLFAR